MPTKYYFCAGCDSYERKKHFTDRPPRKLPEKYKKFGRVKNLKSQDTILYICGKEMKNIRDLNEQVNLSFPPAILIHSTFFWINLLQVFLYLFLLQQEPIPHAEGVINSPPSSATTDISNEIGQQVCNNITSKKLVEI